MTARQPIFRNPDDVREIRSFMLFGAIGAGAKGFMRGSARVGNIVSRPRCIGSVDVDAAANRDFKRLVGVDATTLDMFSLEQYQAFHGRMPRAGCSRHAWHWIPLTALTRPSTTSFPGATHEHASDPDPARPAEQGHQHLFRAGKIHRHPAQ